MDVTNTELMLAGPFDELLWTGQILPLVTHDANAMKGADRW